MALERGLGKGLGALLGDAALQSQEGLPLPSHLPGGTGAQAASEAV